MAEYEVTVVGRIWEGHTCSYTYETAKPIQTLEEANRIAGDFACVTDFTTVEITDSVSGKPGDMTFSTRRRVLRKFDDPKNIWAFDHSRVA